MDAESIAKRRSANELLMKDIERSINEELRRRFMNAMEKAMSDDAIAEYEEAYVKLANELFEYDNVRLLK